jgi:hypothetical protein
VVSRRTASRPSTGHASSNQAPLTRGSYTPRHLTEKILTSKAALEVSWTVHPSLGMAQNWRATCSTVASPAATSKAMASPGLISPSASASS